MLEDEDEEAEPPLPRKSQPPLSVSNTSLLLCLFPYILVNINKLLSAKFPCGAEHIGEGTLSVWY